MTVVDDSSSSARAADLASLAWELTCSAGIVVKIDEVATDRGVERCISARCVAGAHAFLLVPRSDEYFEVWWGEYDAKVRLVGIATNVQSILALARRTCSESLA